MTRSTTQLERDALAIWQAAVAAVQPARVLPAWLAVEGNLLRVGELEFPLQSVRRIVVVGAGKAGATMAAAVEQNLGPQLLSRVSGWVNVPEDCVQPLQAIRLHGARPAGCNEPTEAGVTGSREILRLVESAGPQDLVLALWSGGGSALLPLPVEGIRLADKLAVTRLLSAGGANIRELNTVRKQLSRIKGGGLARACRARGLVSLIISDVLGDPLEIIASGPTVADASTPEEALAILERFDPGGSATPAGVGKYLHQATPASERSFACEVENYVIANCATAVDAAGLEAERRGYSHAMHVARGLEGEAAEVGVHLAGVARRMQTERGPDCLISGGEPVVTLAEASQRGLGGRNQQLALAALAELGEEVKGILLLSGGTDGEDGPTDAAGAWLSEKVAGAAQRMGLEAREYLARCDAYHFFEPCGGLLKTGPTGTNVGDVRVVMVEREELGSA
jgi:hydroxypyruvate reductase